MATSLILKELACHTLGLTSVFSPPRVCDLLRNQCAECPGITVRFTPELVCGMERILHLAYGVITETKKAGKVTGFIISIGIVITLIAWLFAWIGIKIPTLINPWVNYIGFPLIQIGIINMLSRKKKGSKAT